MNFFGHAAVARQVDDHPAFLLGAMAPDLLAMCGAAAGPATSERVAAGQAHHLTVDAAFHGSSAFIAIQSWAVRTLVAVGLRRGPARGAAHVGIELLLDGVLAADRPACAAYQDSLIRAQQMPDPFVWREPAAPARWQAMLHRLRWGTIPHGYRDPDFVGDRLTGVLQRRPRLALEPGEAIALRRFIPALQQRVAADAAALVPQPA